MPSGGQKPQCQRDSDEWDDKLASPKIYMVQYSTIMYQMLACGLVRIPGGEEEPD